jgi:hypothetical protein
MSLKEEQEKEDEVDFLLFHGFHIEDGNWVGKKFEFLLCFGFWGDLEF